MGVIQDAALVVQLYFRPSNLDRFVTSSLGFAAVVGVIALGRIIGQLLLRNPHEPPVVYHWFPFIGSTVSYGRDPYNFFFSCRQKYGDVFTFVLLGRKTTVCLGLKGNDLILNGRLRDVNAEDVYSPLTTPVFGPGVVYDCPNSKLMEQKKFVKSGLTTSTLQSYVELILEETCQYFAREQFSPINGTLDVPPAMAELTIFTASRSLQGKEIRNMLDSSSADLYHDLDMGFMPINLLFPHLPLPQNRRRDRAQRMMADVYKKIIQGRRDIGCHPRGEDDMMWNLMRCVYKDGTPIPDHEIAHLMIALLMAGQHSSASTISWILLRLACRPELQDALLQEQRAVISARVDGSINKLAKFENLMQLQLHGQVIKETLRLHSPIHSMLRRVKNPIVVEGTPYTIPQGHDVLAAPGVTSRMDEYFPEPLLWEPRRWDPVPTETYVHLSPKIARDADDKADFGFGLISKGTASPYLPFGAGRHRCIGEQFAYTQLIAILAFVVHEFRLSTVDGKDSIVGTDYSSLFSRPMLPAIIRWDRRRAPGSVSSQ